MNADPIAVGLGEVGELKGEVCPLVAGSGERDAFLQRPGVGWVIERYGSEGCRAWRKIAMQGRVIAVVGLHPEV